jgi:hypothetical protein
MALEYIDVNDPKEMINPNKQQKATLEALPKLEKFCADNGLSVLDIETLHCVLMRSVQARPLTGA